jgi:hypothetical protein
MKKNNSRSHIILQIFATIVNFIAEISMRYLAFLEILVYNMMMIGTRLIWALESEFLMIKESGTVFSSYLNKIDDQEAIRFNRNVSERQRQAYNCMKQDIVLLKTHLLIDIDFKQEVSIGDCPRR